MFLTQDLVQLQPNHPFQFTPNEIQELTSLFQSPIPSPNSCSDQGSARAVYTMDERKLRRMISNRESARRSRWRKKRHLENLTEQVNQLKVQNKGLKNQLGSVINKSNIICKENWCLRIEAVALWTRLEDLLISMHAMQQQQQPINTHRSYNHYNHN